MQETEDKWRHLRSQLDEIDNDTGDVAKDVGAAAMIVAEEIRQGTHTRGGKYRMASGTRTPIRVTERQAYPDLLQHRDTVSSGAICSSCSWV